MSVSITGFAADTSLRDRSLLSAGTLRDLSKTSEWYAMGTIAFQYVMIVTAAMISIWSGSWMVTVLAVVFIATRQHALAVMMHDAAHFSLSRRRWLNDFISNVFCSFPFFVSTARYRANHLSHHKKTNQNDDPDLDDNVHPESIGTLLWTLCKDLCFVSLPKQLRRGRKFGVLGIFGKEGTSFERCLLAAYLVLAVTLIWYFDLAGKVLLYWYLPFFTVCQAILRFRGYSEHAGRMEGTFLTGARTIRTGFLERIIFAPCNVNRHLEHHLYPSVPAHNLELLSRELRNNKEYASVVKETTGYLSGGSQGVIGELYIRPSSARRSPTGSRRGGPVTDCSP